MNAPNDPLILAFETTGEVCSIALRGSGRTLAERRYRHEMHLSERLLNDVDAVLSEAGVAFDDVNVIAVGLGPGSFTGTRIGVMTAKTLAVVANKLLVGIPSLQAIAAAQSCPSDTFCVPLIPSRGATAFAAIYRVTNDVPELVNDVAVLTANELADAIVQTSATSVMLCGPAANRFDTFAAEIRASGVNVTIGTSNDADAVQVARLAEIRLNVGVAPDDPIELVPLYVSLPAITLPRDPIPTGC